MPASSATDALTGSSQHEPVVVVAAAMVAAAVVLAAAAQVGRLAVGVAALVGGSDLGLLRRRTTSCQLWTNQAVDGAAGVQEGAAAGVVAAVVVAVLLMATLPASSVAATSPPRRERPAKKAVPERSFTLAQTEHATSSSGKIDQFIRRSYSAQLQLRVSASHDRAFIYHPR